MNGEGHSVQIIIRGRVQGVGFRAWVARHAESCRIDGWVRNRPDGSVEVVLAGSPDAIQHMTAVCRVGPPAAIVTDVISLPWTETTEAGFRVRA